MKKLMILLCVALSGCSSIEIASGYLVDEYCDTPQTTRLTVRALVNAGATPHEVKIICDGDQDFFTDSQ